MPYRFLCPRCHGQRTTACKLCGGSGKRLVAGMAVGKCKECNGTGQQRCDVCSGVGEIDARDPKAA
jgi:DnaJ-class molecular chaperone